MKTFIQLKDGIGWASVNTTGDVEGAIEVDSGSGDFYLKKKYENGVWSEASLIRFAEINEEGEIIEIRRTYYSSEVTGPVMVDGVKSDSKWVDGVWVNVERIEPVVPPEVVESPVSNNGDAQNVEEQQAGSQ